MEVVCNKTEECLMLAKLEGRMNCNSSIIGDSHFEPHTHRRGCLKWCHIMPEFSDSRCEPVKKGGDYES